jgi:hypothetical protein
MKVRARRDASADLFKFLEAMEKLTDRENEKAEKRRVKAENKEREEREFVLRDDELAWTEYVRAQLASCENSYGKETKTVIARNIFSFCGETQYDWEIHHPTFVDTIRNKIVEFKKTEGEFGDDIEMLIAHRLKRAETGHFSDDGPFGAWLRTV